MPGAGCRVPGGESARAAFGAAFLCVLRSLLYSEAPAGGGQARRGTGCLPSSCCPSASASPRRDPAVACAKDVRTGLGFAEGSSGCRLCSARPAACPVDALAPVGEGTRRLVSGLPVHGIRVVRPCMLQVQGCTSTVKPLNAAPPVSGETSLVLVVGLRRKSLDPPLR